MDAKRFWGVLGVSVGLFVLSIDWSIVSNALPVIQKNLYTTLAQLQWIMSIFVLSSTVFFVAMGRLSDAYGRKKLFALGLWIGSVAALGSALSHTAPALIAFRALQGLSAAIVLPVSQALLTHTFPKEKHGKATAIWLTTMGAGLSFGPVFGGFITELLSWHWIFFMNLPLLATSFVLVIPFVAESRNETHPKRIDFPGMILIMLFLGSFVFAMIEAPSWGWSSGVILALFATSIVALMGFIWVEMSVKSPLIEFHLFKHPRFIAGALTKFALVFMISGVFFLMPLYFQSVQNRSPAASGLLLLALTLSFTFTSYFIGQTSDRMKKRALLWFGLLLVTLTLLLQMQFHPGSSISFIVTFFIFLGIGWGMSSGPGTSMSLSSLPRDVTGIASGTLVTIQEIGGAVGLAITGTVFRISESAFFEKELYLSHLNLPPQVLDQLSFLLSFHDKLTAYLSKLSPAAQEMVENVFQQAFLHGFHRGLWVSTGVVFGCLILTFLLLGCKMRKRTKVNG